MLTCHRAGTDHNRFSQSAAGEKCSKYKLGSDAIKLFYWWAVRNWISSWLTSLVHSSYGRCPTPGNITNPALRKFRRSGSAERTETARSFAPHMINVA